MIPAAFCHRPSPVDDSDTSFPRRPSATASYSKLTSRNSNFPAHQSLLSLPAPHVMPPSLIVPRSTVYVVMRRPLSPQHSASMTGDASHNASAALPHASLRVLPPGPQLCIPYLDVPVRVFTLKPVRIPLPAFAARDFRGIPLVLREGHVTVQVARPLLLTEMLDARPESSVIALVVSTARDLVAENPEPYLDDPLRNGEANLSATRLSDEEAANIPFKVDNGIPVSTVDTNATVDALMERILPKLRHWGVRCINVHIGDVIPVGAEKQSPEANNIALEPSSVTCGLDRYLARKSHTSDLDALQSQRSPSNEDCQQHQNVRPGKVSSTAHGKVVAPETGIACGNSSSRQLGAECTNQSLPRRENLSPPRQTSRVNPRGHFIQEPDANAVALKEPGSLQSASAGPPVNFGYEGHLASYPSPHCHTSRPNPYLRQYQLQYPCENISHPRHGHYAAEQIPVMNSTMPRYAINQHSLSRTTKDYFQPMESSRPAHAAYNLSGQLLPNFAYQYRSSSHFFADKHVLRPEHFEQMLVKASNDQDLEWSHSRARNSAAFHPSESLPLSRDTQLKGAAEVESKRVTSDMHVAGEQQNMSHEIDCQVKPTAVLRPLSMLKYDRQYGRSQLQAEGKLNQQDQSYRNQSIGNERGDKWLQDEVHRLPSPSLLRSRVVNTAPIKNIFDSPPSKSMSDDLVPISQDSVSDRRKSTDLEQSRQEQQSPNFCFDDPKRSDTKSSTSRLARPCEIINDRVKNHMHVSQTENFNEADQKSTDALPGDALDVSEENLGQVADLLRQEKTGYQNEIVIYGSDCEFTDSTTRLPSSAPLVEEGDMKVTDRDSGLGRDQDYHGVVAADAEKLGNYDDSLAAPQASTVEQTLELRDAQSKFTVQTNKHESDTIQSPSMELRSSLVPTTVQPEDRGHILCNLVESVEVPGNSNVQDDIVCNSSKEDVADCPNRCSDDVCSPEPSKQRETANNGEASKEDILEENIGTGSVKISDSNTAATIVNAEGKSLSSRNDGDPRIGKPEVASSPAEGSAHTRPLGLQPPVSSQQIHALSVSKSNEDKARIATCGNRDPRFSDILQRQDCTDPIRTIDLDSTHFESPTQDATVRSKFESVDVRENFDNEDDDKVDCAALHSYEEAPILLPVIRNTLGCDVKSRRRPRERRDVVASLGKTFIASDKAPIKAIFNGEAGDSDTRLEPNIKVEGKSETGTEKPNETTRSKASKLSHISHGGESPEATFGNEKHGFSPNEVKNRDLLPSDDDDSRFLTGPKAVDVCRKSGQAGQSEKPERAEDAKRGKKSSRAIIPEDRCRRHDRSSSSSKLLKHKSGVSEDVLHQDLGGDALVESSKTEERKKSRRRRKGDSTRDRELSEMDQSYRTSTRSSASGRRHRSEKRRSSSRRDASPECPVCTDCSLEEDSATTGTTNSKPGLVKSSSRRRRSKKGRDSDSMENSSFSKYSISVWSAHRTPQQSIYRHVTALSESESSDDDGRCIWDSSDSEGEARRRRAAMRKREQRSSRRPQEFPARENRNVRFSDYCMEFL